MLGMILGLLGSVIWLVGFVCGIIVVVKMIQNGKLALGIVSLICFFCVVGHIIAMVVGWQNADRWNIRTLMMAYTACIVVGFLFLTGFQVLKLG